MRIVVTGSSTGIGRALAERLLRRGHRVWGLARSETSGLVGATAENFGASCCDVALWSQVESAAAELAQHWGGLDGLVACAGLQGEVGPVVRADPARWAATVRVNLDGTFHALRAFHPLLARAERRAKVVCFSGGGATKPRVNFSAYGVAKTAVVRLVETAAAELAGERIDINAVAPGAINTRLTDEVLALGPAVAGAAEYEAARRQKAGGGGSMERALDLVEWLLSAASDGLSGRLISAPWDPWREFEGRGAEISAGDLYTLRRITPEDRRI
ncbi:MAG TPA: SDR family oxidoreductase [Opitutaceae bacterium]|nr:SDR family oxidoreductase [Opitutaceae bacterium]